MDEGDKIITTDEKLMFINNFNCYYEKRNKMCSKISFFQYLEHKSMDY